MLFYLSAFFIVVMVLLLFYFSIGHLIKKKKKNISSISYGISKNKQHSYIEAANRCKKDNSPVSNEPFNKLYIEGADMINRESFKINDWIIEGSEYHVI